MKTTITVSKDNIRHGEMITSDNCIIRRAIRDSLPIPEMIWVGVDSFGIRGYDGSLYGPCPLPSYIEKYIINMIRWNRLIPKFMRPLFFRPFTFEMDVPDEFVAKEPERERRELCVK